MIHELSGLVSDETMCDRVINYFKDTNQRSLWQDDTFFSGRTLSPSEIEDGDLRKEINCLVYKITQMSFSLYKKFIFPEFLDIVYWAPDMEMGVHTDDQEENLIQRHYTAVCYLNDDYEGGETYLPENNYICRPEKGKVIIFPSNYPHGVTKVKNNSRYTLAMWFTTDEKYLLDS
jgi:hypothetical protein